MAHQLIIGMTECGKSTLMKRLGSSLRERGEECLALNPTGEQGYTRRDQYGEAGADFETSDPDDFEAEVRRRVEKNKKRRYLIIDEAYMLFPRGTAPHVWLALRGRHYGLNLIAGTQRAADLNISARTQFADLWIFRCSMTDAEFAADQWGQREIETATGLPTGHFYRVSGGRLTKGRLFDNRST